MIIIKLKNNLKLISTLSEKVYITTRLEERGEKGEPLEIKIENIKNATIKKGINIWDRFEDFLPFYNIDPTLSLGEGNTAIINASDKLKKYCGLNRLLLKNETQNPTWSFKDRGSLACIWLAKALNENKTATISTGNMGNSIAAYGGKAGIKTIVFLPAFTPEEKIAAIGIHGAEIYKVKTDNYSAMKKKILNYSNKLNLRIISGNNPFRVEGYKLTAFEIYEQLKGDLPDYIAVPTSACGHIRGIFKGFKELKEANLINELPKMIVVQAKNNSPIVEAIKKNQKSVIPEKNVDTIAEAITSGNPYGGNEIINKSYKYNWLAENVSEKEIMKSQKLLARDGLFVEPASATSLAAIKKLRKKSLLKQEDSVMLMLTGSGLKDIEVVKNYNYKINKVDVKNVEEWF